MADNETTSKLASMIRERVNSQSAAAPAVGASSPSDAVKDTQPLAGAGMKRENWKKAKGKPCFEGDSERLSQVGERKFEGCRVFADTSSGPSISVLEDSGLISKSEAESPFGNVHLEYELVAVRDWRFFGLRKRYSLLAVDSIGDTASNCSVKAARRILTENTLVAVSGSSEASDDVRALMKCIPLDIVCLTPEGDQPLHDPEGLTTYGHIVEGLSSLMIDANRDTVLIHV